MATPSLQSLERGLSILRALNQAPGMGIDSLSTLLSLSRGTTYRLLETLRRGGYVEREGGRGKYVVTDRVLCLSDGCRDDGNGRTDHNARVANAAKHFSPGPKSRAVVLHATAEAKP